MPDRYRALLIANSVFSEDARLPGLNGPVNDAFNLRSALEDTSRGLFSADDILVLSERNASDLLHGLEEFFGRADRDDVLLLYYSGHGWLDENNTLYLCARDTITDRLRSTAISSHQLKDISSNSAASRLIVILDCCHSGTFKGTDIALPIAGRGRFVIAACGPQQLAVDAPSPAEGSLFTNRLVHGLRGAIARPRFPGIITLDDLYEHVHQQLASYGEQLPYRRFDGQGQLAVARHVADLASAAQPLGTAQDFSGDRSPWAVFETFRGHTRRIWDVAFSPTQAIGVSGGDDKIVRVWSANSALPVLALAGHQSTVWGVALSPDGGLIASGSNDKTVRLWNADSGAHVKTLLGHTKAIQGVAISPTQSLLASASNDSTVRLWNSVTGEWLRTLTGHTGEVWGVAFSPRSSLLASCSADGTVRLWDPETGEHLRSLTGHSAEVWAVAFSPSGQIVATSSIDGTVRLWSPFTGETLRTLINHAGIATSVTFSPVGNLLATSSSDGMVTLWQPRTGQRIRMLTGHTDIATSVAFNAEGTVLASSSEDRTVQLRSAQGVSL